MTTPPITIWVHGTKPLKILPGPLGRIHINSLHKFMHCRPGLHLAQDLDPIFHHHNLAQAIAMSSPTQFPWDNFYLFGWSGALNVAERISNAHILYEELCKLVQEYENKYHTKPFIRIITHSHGGNIALNMATITDQPAFTIQELVLLACPVQKKTAPLIAASLFEAIYSLHSHGDFVQIADPQGWPDLKEQLKKIFKDGPLETLKTAFNNFERKSFFSGRHFSPSQKIVQTRIKMNNRDPLHVEFMLPPFITMIPQILATVRSQPHLTQQKDLLVTVDTHKKEVLIPPFDKP